jgi:predicted ATPase
MCRERDDSSPLEATGRLSELEYVFRHALTQDVAYGSLLQAERRRLHAMIGTALEELYAGRLEARTEELVYHFRRGQAPISRR